MDKIYLVLGFAFLMIWIAVVFGYVPSYWELVGVYLTMSAVWFAKAAKEE